MPTSYTSLLGLALPVTGELSGTWGDTVNQYITQYVDAAVAGAQTISGSQTAVTLSVTNGSSLTQAGAGATGSAQYQIINCTGNPASALTVTVPSASKVYLVLNNTSTNQTVTVKGAATTGVTVAAARCALIAWNGTDFELVATDDASKMNGVLAAANGGTGQSSYTVGDILFASGSTTLSKLADVATGNALISGGVGVAPSYGKIGLTTHVSGTLPIANGGTNGTATPTAGTIAYGTGSAYAFNTAGTSGQPLLSGGSGAPTFGTLSVGAGGTGQTSYTDGQLLIGNTATTSLSKATLTAGSGVTITNGNGSITISATGSGGTVTSVGATAPVASSGGTAPTISLNSAYGDTLNPYGSKTANFFLAAPNGAAGAPTFRAIVAADIPTLNQNTTGTASNVTGTVAVANGGTGATTAPNARTNLGATTVGSNFFTLTNPTAVTFPRINADNTVSALDAATFRSAIGAGTGNGTVTSVATAGTVNGITLTGGTITGSGTITLGGTLSGVSLTTQVTGTLPVANGGTGATTLTANNVLLGNGTSALQVVAPGSNGNVLTSNGTTWVSQAPAPSGGTVTATASGSISNAAPAILNSDGTVSAVAITVGTTAAVGTALSSPSVPGSVGIPNLLNRRSAIYVASRNIVAVTFNSSSGFRYIWTGTPNNNDITWTSSITSIGSLPASNSYSLIYMPNVDRIVATWVSGSQIYYITLSINSDNTLSILKSQDVIGTYSGWNFQKTSTKYDPFTGKLVYAMQENTGDRVATLVAQCNGTTGVLTSGVGPVSLGIIQSGTSSNYAIDVTTNPADGKVFYIYGGAFAGSNVIVGQLSSANDNVTNISSPIGVPNSTAADGVGTSIVYDSPNNVIYTWYFNNTGGNYVQCAASVSGYTVSFGTSVSANTAGNEPSPILSLPSTNQYVYFTNSGTATMVRTSLSGTTITSATTTFTGASFTIRDAMVADSTRMRYIGFTASSVTMSYQFLSNITSTLTTTNFLGLSDASYTNGQTATVKTVGSTKGSLSGLTAGLKYYVTVSGTFAASDTGVYAGLALNSTTLLVKG